MVSKSELYRGIFFVINNILFYFIKNIYIVAYVLILKDKLKAHKVVNDLFH